HLIGAIDQAALDEQRGVVQNEKRQGENQPYGRVFEMLYAAVYPPGHPYHHTTIGSMADLNAASLDDVKNWFRSWYGPNNAVLVLAGDIDLATAKEKVTRFFGDIPPTATVAKMRAQIAPRSKTTREATTDQVPQTRIYRVWNVPGAGTDDSDRMDVLAYVLGGARSSRLDRRLVHQDKSVDSISAGNETSELGGMFIIQATVKAGGDPAAVEKAIDEEVAKLLAKGPTPEELAQARNFIQAGFIRGLERIGGFGGKGDALASCAIYTGKPSCYQHTLDNYNKVTAAQLQALGKKWLSKGDHVLTVAPGTRPAVTEPAPPTNLPPTKIAPPDKKLKVVATDVDRTKGVQMPATFPSLTFPKLQRATLPNGLKIILAERRGLPLVQMRLEIQGAGFSSDPGARPGFASFTMGMLDEGAGSYSALALGDKLEGLGAQLGTAATLDFAFLSLSSITDKLDESLAVFSDVLLRPTMDPAELERVRATWLAGIKQEKARPNAIARRVAPGLLFGTGHAYAAPASGTEASITGIKREEAVEWVKQRLRPDRATLIVVGDISLAELQPKLLTALGTWKPPATPAPMPLLSLVKLPAKPRVFLVDQPGAIQANIWAGHVIPSSKDAGEIDFEIASSVLGGEFGSRLNMNLREAKHWAYGSYSFPNQAVGQRTWAATAAVQIDKTIDSIKELEREIREYATGKAPAKPEELTKIQSTEVRGLPGNYETGAAVLETVSGFVNYGRGDDYPATRATRITAMKPADVTTAARALKPDSLTWVIVGDLSKIEKGIRDLKLGDVKVIDADGKVLR
ncbi:MAG: pitrilysin family protein, partial [Polyangiales bacterium]